MNKVIKADLEVESVTDLFIRYLAAESITHVFGIPGGLLFPFFDRIEKDPDFTLIVSRHEEGAAFMADGYARLSGKMAVCAGTAGPGATNLLTGVACAYTDGIPMLVVTGQAQSAAVGKGAAQETSADGVDVVAMFNQVTKYSVVVNSAERLSYYLERAFRTALAGRPGPVHLNVPVDLWNQTIATQTRVDATAYRALAHVCDREGINLASEKLVAAQYPSILAGSGITGETAKRNLIAIAERLGARVATTPRAKGVFPEDHPLSVGVLGFGGHTFAREMFLDSQIDVLLTLGASLNETTTFNWHRNLLPSETLIQLDIDPIMIGRNYPVDIGIVGDAEVSLSVFAQAVERRVELAGSTNSQWDSLASTKESDGWYLNADLRQDATRMPLAPQRWRAELQNVLPDDVVLFSDIGGHMLFNIHHFKITANQKFVLNFGFGSMGHGLAAPIGAALADSQKTIVAITGDACFTMNGMEVLTAIEYDIPVIWIVENNQMHGISWHGSADLTNGKGLESIKLKHRLNVSAVSAAMGADAYCVDAPNQIEGVFKNALDVSQRSRRPAVIEILTDASIAPPIKDRSDAIAGFKDK